MKLLVDARAMGKRPSGIGMYIYNMISELRRYSDYEIVLISDIAESDEIRILEKQGIRLCLYGKEIKKNLALWNYYKYVQQCILEEKPEVFWEGNNLIPMKVNNPYGKMMVTIYDMFPLTHPEHYGIKYKYYFKYGLMKTVHNFDTLVYISKETKEETECLFPEAKKKKNFVSYIIVDKLPQEHITDNDSFLYVGNLETRKGTDLLLLAYKRYRELGGRKKLRLAGKMREKGIMQLYQQISGATDGLSYLGYLDVEERNREYASCSAFVFPSRAEGFGMPVVEVMNYNKPILVLDLNIYHEIVGDAVWYAKMPNDKDAQIESLANAMLAMSYDVDREKYADVLKRYSGKTVVSNLLSMIEA